MSYQYLTDYAIQDTIQWCDVSHQAERDVSYNIASFVLDYKHT